MSLRKLSFYLTHILYPILMYGCFFEISIFVLSQYGRTIEQYDAAAAKMVAGVLALPILLAFFSTARIFVTYDFAARARCLERGGGSQRFLGRLRETLCSYEFWVSAALIAFIVWMMAPNPLYRMILDAYFYAGNDAVQNRLSRLVFIPAHLILLLLAHVSARKQWLVAGSRSVLADIFMATGMLLLAGAAYGLGTIMLVVVYPLARAVFNPSFGIPLLIIILVIIGFFLFLAYGRALVGRRRLIKRLLALCRQEGFDISPIKAPYRSLFRLVDGPSFVVTAHKKTYTCKLISCVRGRSSTALHFYKDGACRFVRAVRFKRMDVVRFETDFQFAFEGEGKKLLIIDPMPRMFLTDMGQSLPLATGDKAWSYKIFSAKGFLGNLDRDCLDR